MSSPVKHKSIHHHHHHHHNHREYSHSSSSYSSGSTPKTTQNFSSTIKIQDNSKTLPHYSVALSRPHDECMPMEELDAIQLELETLLSSVSLRYRALKTEFDCMEDRKHQKKNADKACSPSTSGTKRKRDEKKSSSKDGSRYNQHSKHSKSKSSSSKLLSHSQHTDHANSTGDMGSYPLPTTGHSHTNPKLLLPKNDAPHKFWVSVEQYCMQITQEDLKLLDNLIDEYVEPPTIVPSIPELGPHYAVRWASDEIRDESDTFGSNAKSNKRISHASSATADPKKGYDKMAEGICGPLTQRLVSALINENTEMQSDIVGCSDPSDQNSTDRNSSSTNRTQASGLASLLKSGIDVEKSLKKELLELGIFDANDFAKDKEDEVLNEINRVRSELQAIADYNRTELKILRAAAKEEMKRLEVKRKLDRVDSEIIEAYKRIVVAKQKRQSLTKQEKTDIYRLADEQKRLSDQLEAIPIPGFNFTVGGKATSSSTKADKSGSVSNTSKV